LPASAAKGVVSINAAAVAAVANRFRQPVFNLHQNATPFINAYYFLHPEL
jgi:hypothetical protein